MSANQCQVIVVGGGIAGASVAYFLTRRGVTDVVILEREDLPGYHTTGRSAAVLVELDENRTMQRLIAAAAPFFRSPPAGFADHALLEPSGILFAYDGAEWDEARALIPTALADGIRAEELSAADVLARFEGRLARFKHPKDVLFVEALPTTAIGKVRKDDVRLLVQQRLGAGVAPAQEQTA